MLITAFSLMGAISKGLLQIMKKFSLLFASWLLSILTLLRVLSLSLSLISAFVDFLSNMSFILFSLLEIEEYLKMHPVLC